jgi:hypothetical protein
MNPSILHKKNWLTHFFNKNKVAITGGYHYGNLGDIALGCSIKDVLQEQNIKSELQTIYNLKYWLERDYAIVGGGAIGYENSLLEIIKRHGNNYKKVAFMGVDFNSSFYSDESIELINKASFVSTRSKSQAERLKELTGRLDIYSQPDLAFAFQRKQYEQIRKSKSNSRKKLFINVLPLYAMFNNGIVKPINAYKTERPEVFENFLSIQQNYKTLIVNEVNKALKEGKEVYSWSFTPMDEAYAKFLLKGLAVNHLSYNPDPAKILATITPSDEVITTRLHATIFGFRSGAKVKPIAYARKNEELLKEMGFNKSDYLNAEDLILLDKLPNITLKPEEKVLNKMEENSHDMILKGINILLAN